MARSRAWSRRTFLRRAGLAGVGLAVGCAPDEEKSGRNDGSHGGRPADSASGGDSGAPDSAADTGFSEDAWGEIRGPFYREGAPERHDLNILGEEGTTIRLHFRVLDAACQPIAGAVVEVWHCAPEAAYDMSSEDMRFYGKVITDEQGRGWFTTLEPPPYLDENGVMRPHIHYVLNASGFTELVAQTKFAHDEALDEPLDSPVVVTFEDDGSGVLVGTHSFVMSAAA
jgi:hypothetical protein